ncbi:OmpA family protein [Paracoccus alkanivorans]|uniref:OmpA family protein n=1 Tax=Paracoccus alkanivorans TaxID=2116655 RepID=A0A3M0LZ47_9RHOB|nr:OmpA family protein [Paracoccus alkanivorans]RMC30798.1 OmpA family protein [Paracoccus alkanivorans]
MRRIARNTTAIITCLSLLMPSLAQAQQSGDGGVAQKVFEDLQKQSEKDKEKAKRQSEAQKKKKQEQKARAEERRREAEKAREARKQAAERERERRKERQEAQREERRKEQAAEARREERRKQARQEAREEEKAAQARREERREREEAQREQRRKEQAAEARREERRKQARQEAREEEKAAQARREERREREEAQRERRQEARQDAREEQARRAERARKAEERRAERRRERNAAAREAARETRAPEAAALSALLGSGNVFRQRITDENSRSSDEDFATSLRDALSNDRDRDRWRRESRWREEERRRWEERNRDRDDDDDDDNDLTKVLLLGLGALAVGSMLNNNRQVALSSPDRVVVTHPDGSQELIKDDAALLRQPGSNVETEQFDDGSSRTVVTRADGSKVVTIRDADMRVLRRTLISPDGRTSQLIDDTQEVQPVDITSLPPAPAPVGLGNAMDEEALRAALNREANIDRRFTLGQIRNIHEVRSLVAPVDIPAITFDTGSAAIPPGQAQQLSALGRVIGDSIRENPQEIYMIEGYTDTVGDPAMNLALSDRRAESVALALTEYFDVPPENLVVQGYGEDYLKVAEEGDIRANRRSSVRRITDLLQTAAPE